MGGVLAEAADAGVMREDAAADQLASYCLHTLTAAPDVSCKAAIGRLVMVTVSGLAAPPPTTPGLLSLTDSHERTARPRRNGNGGCFGAGPSRSQSSIANPARLIAAAVSRAG